MLVYPKRRTRSVSWFGKKKLKFKKVILGVVGVRVPVADLVEERVGDLVRPGEQLAVGQVDRELPVRVQDRRRGSLVGGLDKSKSEIQCVPIFTI